MNKEEFIKEVSKLGINLTEKQLSQLDTYCNYLLEVNQHTNLTAIKEKDQVYLKHFYDSLTIAKIIDLKNQNNLIDVGTGAGFPGLVLKIIYENLHVTLLDSNNKKINFLKELSQKLELTNIEFVHDRVEEFASKNREKFAIVTARAVTNLTALSELCLPLTKIGGYFIPLKGANEEEINDSFYAIKVLGGKLENKITFELPNGAGTRNILSIRKIETSPIKYPRRYEKIKNNPLKNNGK